MGYTKYKKKRKEGTHVSRHKNEALALWREAFPGEDDAFTDALFALGFPDFCHGIFEDGQLVCMLFALPYDVVTSEGVLPARYLYAVATAKAHRGKGYAKQLIAEVAAQYSRVFLRPMSPSLFAFYARAGLSPLSPHSELCGVAGTERTGVRDLSPTEYIAARDAFLTPPYCRMTPDFLRLAYLGGGAVTDTEGRFVALYERRGEQILFKEWLGDVAHAPRATAYLGGEHFCLRRTDAAGTPFGMGHGLAAETVFLVAMD